MNNFYQVCYGKPDQINWSAFNVSENATSNIISFFETEAGKNSPGRDAVNKVFIKNNPCFFTLTSKEGMTEISKISYDFADVKDRTVMFAHGFVFDENEKILEKPEQLFAVSSDNFKFSVEETKCIPSELKMNPIWSTEAAMKFANIGKEALDGVMAAVNVFLNDSTKAMRIVYDGNEEQCKALMYLILHFLPYRLRYDLSFTTADNSTSNEQKCIVISDKAASLRHYINLVNNETDFDINEDDIKEIKKEYPFYREYVNNFDNFDSFASDFQTCQTKLGFDYLCSYVDLDLIYSFYVYSCNNESFDKIAKSDTEFGNFAFKVFNNAPLGNVIIDDYIARIIDEYLSRELKVTEYIINLVSARSKKSSAVAMKQAEEKLSVKYLLSLGEEKSVEALYKQYKSDFDSFRNIARIIKEFKGTSIIYKLYVSLVNTCNDCEELKLLLEEYRQISGENEDIFRNKLLDFGCKQVSEALSNGSDINNVLDSFSKIYDKMFGDEGSSEFLDEIVERFWKNYDINGFEFNDNYIENLNSIKGSKSEPDLVVVLCKTYDLIKNIENSDNRKKLADKYDFFELDEYKLSQEMKNKVCAAVRDSYSNGKKVNLRFWYKTALFGSESNLPKQAVMKLIEWNIDVFVDDKCFEKFFDDADAKKVRFAKVLLSAINGDDGLFNDVSRKSDEYYLLKSKISTLTKIIKRYDKKGSDNETSDFTNKIKNLFSRR